MATIVYRDGRPKPWLAQIKRKGHGVYSRSFALENDAKVWARKEDLNIDEQGRPFTIKQYDKITVADLCKRYLEEVSPSKSSYTTDKSILTNIQKYSIAKKSIATVSYKDAADYRNERLNEKIAHVQNVRAPFSERTYITTNKPVTPSTIRRAVNTLQHVFAIAKTEWGYHNINNPFHRLRIKGSQPRRNRRLLPGELLKLIEATDHCRTQRQFIKLAIVLAVHTGMRLQEIFNLTFEDIGITFNGHFDEAIKELNRRRIVIRKSKTDYRTGLRGRTIVMSVGARAILMSLMLEIGKYIFETGYPIRGTLFPMSKESFKQSWKVVIRLSGIKDLTFHDLRHEAASRFDELGLSRSEHNLMMGHNASDVTSLYIHADLNRIQTKLDKPIYDKVKTRIARETFGLPLLGDEIDEDTRGYKFEKMPSLALWL